MISGPGIRTNTPASGRLVVGGAAHVAHADDADRRLANTVCHECTSRFDLEMDIRMPIPKPSVAMAVPP